jgi:CheY-like chemotaxis protein
MIEQSDMILVVDSDPEARALLRDGVLAAKTFRVIEAKDGPDALLMFKQHSPHLILIDWQLPGLAGRDVLVALKAQGYRGPAIVMSDGGTERTISDAFRLGATDYLRKPIREAEALAAIERALGEIRLRRQRDGLVAQLEAANRDLEGRAKELMALSAVGQAVTSLRDMEKLFDHILESALAVTKADHGFLLLRDEKAGQLLLKAGRNLRLALLDRLGEGIQDPLADLVLTSREPLNVAGEGLRKFTAAKDVYAVAYVPLLVQGTPVGVLAVGNAESQTPFVEGHVRLLRAVGDHAAMAIVNARLFAVLEQRSKALELATRELREREAQRSQQYQALAARLGTLEAELLRLARGEDGPVSAQLSSRLAGLGQQVKQLGAMLGGLVKR